MRALSAVLERDSICQVTEFGEVKNMLESSDCSFDEQPVDKLSPFVSSPYYCSLPRSEEVPFMQKSLPNFNEVYKAIQNMGNCIISGFKKLEDVSDALQRYGDVRVYHSSNQDPAILEGGKILGAIWNDSGEPGQDINIAVIKATESGTWESDDFVLHPGQVVLWDPSDVLYLPLSPNSEGDRKTSGYCSFTVVVDPETIDAAKEHLAEFQGPFGLRTRSQSRFGS